MHQNHAEKLNIANLNISITNSKIDRLAIISLALIVIISLTNHLSIVAATAPGITTSPPSISNWGPGQGGHLNAFVLGNDSSIWNNPFFNNTWHSWTHTGNTGDPGHPSGISITSPPAAISRDVVNKIIDVFAKGSDNSIWRLCFNGANWGSWIHVGNTGDPGHPSGISITSPPSVTSWNSTDMQVFARGSDNNVWYNYFHSSSSTGSCNGSWSGWKSINPSVHGAAPIYLLNLGYDSGSRNTGWEWGSAQYQSSTPDRLTTINKNSIQPPSPDPNGMNAAKMTIKHGDVYTDPAGHTSARAEVVLTNKLPDRPNDPNRNLFREGDDIWLHWYTLFPTNAYPTSSDKNLWQVWTQWHQSDASTACCTPTMEFNVLGSNLALRVLGHIWDAQNCFTVATGQCGYKWVAPIQKGSWYEILLHVKWSTQNNVGYMEMYVNHIPVSQNAMGKNHPFATLDSDGLAYLKQGLYRNPNIPFDQTIYHDGMQVVKCPPNNIYYHPETQQCYNTAPY